MNVFKLTYPFGKTVSNKQAIAMGFFDGVHVGHQKIINEAINFAQTHKIESAVLTYNVHPKVYFQNDQSFRYLTPLDQRIQKFEELGVDNVFVIEFTPEFTALSPQEFVDNALMKLNPAFVVAGTDHLYGAVETGATMEQLPEYAQGRFEVKNVDLETLEGNKISSSRIRGEMAKGNIKMVNTLLGYEYENFGEVVHGDARGRELGFPTVNIQVPTDQLIPDQGVYLTKIQIEGKWYQSMTSIGTNPTFEPNRQITVETNVFDFDQDVYGQTVHLKYLDYLRSQMKFDGVDALIEQLHADMEQSQKMFDLS